MEKDRSSVWRGTGPGRVTSAIPLGATARRPDFCGQLHRRHSSGFAGSEWLDPRRFLDPRHFPGACGFAAWGQINDVAEFLPYWDNQRIVQVASPRGVYASIYRKAGKSLLVVSNLTGQDVEEQVQVDFQKIGLEGEKVRVQDALTGATIASPVGAHPFPLVIQSKNFRLLTLSKQAGNRR